MAPISATEPKDADIIWTSVQVDEEMKKAAGLNDEQYINQFPFEACLVMKHYLAETVQKVKIATHFLKGLFYFPPPPFPVFFDVKLDLPYIRNR